MSLRLWQFPFSTNVDRVALALGHKGLEAEPVRIDPADRGGVRALSGQDLVPVLEDGDEVVAGSLAILRHLEERFPQRPLWPADPALGAQVDVFCDWFDRVWKAAPNAIADGEGDPAPHAAAMAWALDRFEALLAAGDHLLGPFTAADCAAWPFLRYADPSLRDPADDEPFHLVLERHQPLGDDHPRLAAWIRRMAARPGAAAAPPRRP